MGVRKWKRNREGQKKENKKEKKWKKEIKEGLRRDWEENKERKLGESELKTRKVHWSLSRKEEDKNGKNIMEIEIQKKEKRKSIRVSIKEKKIVEKSEKK